MRRFDAAVVVLLVMVLLSSLPLRLDNVIITIKEEHAVAVGNTTLVLDPEITSNNNNKNNNNNNDNNNKTEISTTNKKTETNKNNNKTEINNKNKTEITTTTTNNNNHQRETPDSTTGTFMSWPKTDSTTNNNKNHSDTAIVMFDTRRLDVEDLNSSLYIYHRWTADLNYQYAMRHKYDFFYIQSEGVIHHDVPSDAMTMEEDGPNSVFKSRETCYLEIPDDNITEPRGAPWCKLLGVAAVLERGYYETIVMIDSDAFFKLGAPDIKYIVENGTTTADNTNIRKDERLLWVPRDLPRHPKRPNTGLQIWNTRQQQQSVWNLLIQWWQMKSNPRSHAYEQSGLTHLFRQVKQNREACGVGLLDIKYMMIKYWNDPNLHVVHLMHAAKRFREKIMRTEWFKITNATQNAVLNRVVIMTANETFRLQKILGIKQNQSHC